VFHFENFLYQRNLSRGNLPSRARTRISAGHGGRAPWFDLLQEVLGSPARRKDIGCYVSDLAGISAVGLSNDSRLIAYPEQNQLYNPASKMSTEVFDNGVQSTDLVGLLLGRETPTKVGTLTPLN
jgi:hypothetical protein